MNSRTYLYLLPTFSFASHTEKNNEAGFRIESGVIDNVNKLLAVYKGTRNFHNFTSGLKGCDWYGIILRSNPNKNIQKLGLSLFFIAMLGKLPTDPSAKRFVMEMSCGAPFVVDDMEFCVISGYHRYHFV